MSGPGLLYRIWKTTNTSFRLLLIYWDGILLFFSPGLITNCICCQELCLKSSLNDLSYSAYEIIHLQIEGKSQQRLHNFKRGLIFRIVYVCVNIYPPIYKASKQATFTRNFCFWTAIKDQIATVRHACYSNYAHN